jgi:putative membrane protein
LLAYIRTGLYFVVAGSTLGQLIQTLFWNIMGIPLVVTGLIIVLIGFTRYVRLKKSIEVSRHNIGSASEAFIKSVRD